MASTITHTTGTLTPAVVDGWRMSREARSRVHTILGRSAPDVTLRPAGMRKGALRCVFATEATAAAAVAVFATPQVLTFTDTDRPLLAGSFVVADGDIELELDDTTRNTWVVTVPFQEVSP